MPVLPIIGLIVGVILGLLFIPTEFAFQNSAQSYTYVAVAILAALAVFALVALRKRQTD